MKTKLTLLSIVLITLIGCSTPDNKQSNECDCVKTYYLYFPAMSFGGSFVPEHYDVVDQQVGQFDCQDETSGYVHDVHAGYTHYKIECD